MPALLRSLSARLGGALALVSGRSLAQLDRLLGDDWPAAGLHGLERRDGRGQVRRSDIEPQRLAAARALLANLGEQAPGLLLEDKGVALAMHYRNAPERADEVRASIERAAADLGEEFHVQPGAQVLELKPRSATKATAIESFMHEPPFAGRRPVFVGDDFTDLDGFAAVEAHGGLTIAVGPRIKGMLNLPGPDALLRLLEEVVAR